jgi:ureidoglycolate lyase
MRPYLVIVAADGSGPIVERIRVFLSSGSQGVNYRRNTWHHALVALHQVSRFLVVDRGGAGENCEEVALEDVVLATLGQDLE